MGNSISSPFRLAECAEKPLALQASGFQEALQGPDWRVQLWVRDRDQTRFAGVFEVVMATFRPDKTPAIRLQHPNYVF
jgi:hypothetical protein